MPAAEPHFQRVYIEITNRCNLRCSFCTRTAKAPRDLSAAEFERILHQVQSYTNLICLHVQGEPLLHPGFEEILTCCDHSGIRVHLVTNGTLLARHPQLQEHRSLYKISFSLQSLPFQGSDREETLQRIMVFARQASAAGRPYVELRFWRTEQLNSPEIQTALRVLCDHPPLQDTAFAHQKQILPYVRICYDNAFVWPAAETEKTGTAGTCLGGRKQLAVLSDGTVTACCLDADGQICFGNVLEQDLADILAGTRYQNFLTALRQHVLLEPLCQRCTYRSRFEKTTG